MRRDHKLQVQVAFIALAVLAFPANRLLAVNLQVTPSGNQVVLSWPLDETNDFLVVPSPTVVNV